MNHGTQPERGKKDEGSLHEHAHPNTNRWLAPHSENNQGKRDGNGQGHVEERKQNRRAVTEAHTWRRRRERKRGSRTMGSKQNKKETHEIIRKYQKSDKKRRSRSMTPNLHDKRRDMQKGQKQRLRRHMWGWDGGGRGERKRLTLEESVKVNRRKTKRRARQGKKEKRRASTRRSLLLSSPSSLCRCEVSGGASARAGVSSADPSHFFLCT